MAGGVRRTRRRNTATGWGVDFASLDLFMDEMRNVPKDMRRQVRKAIVKATADIRNDMARRASWSSRIPGAIGVRVAFAQARTTIRVDARKAPHARPYEGVGRGNTFRHPVYGNYDIWVTQGTRSFFFPAVRTHRKATREAVERAVYEALPRR